MWLKLHLINRVQTDNMEKLTSTKQMMSAHAEKQLTYDSPSKVTVNIGTNPEKKKSQGQNKKPRRMVSTKETRKAMPA